MTSNLGTSWSEDICRVCRSEGSHDKPLFHPCICTGSIKFIHQECLLQWLKYSRKEYCELCNHRFSFMPIYSPDMPKRLPVKDIFSGLLRSLGTAIRFWLHYTLVAVAWLGIVPLTACRIYRCLFTGSFSSLLSLPLELFSTENILSDSLYGCCVVTCTLCAFISLVWLREQILHGGGPDWLEQEQEQHVANLHVADNNNIPNVNLAGAAPINQHVANIHAADNNNINVAGPLNQHGANNNNGPNVNVAGAVPMNPDQDADNENDNNGAQDDINWNPIEWDRAAEELTWERLLGLDGSLVFLEHVFWVVSLNTLFILLFAFFPYHIGQLTVSGLGLKSQISATEFEGLLTTFCGYLLVGVVLALLHGGAALVRLQKTKRLLGLCYVVIKVSLLSVVEVGVFPLVCGWWLDICSLTLLDASIKDREASFRLAPGTSMFIHWLVGMVYVFYFASFILLLREVLRPGVLWFLRNLNDPDFNPIYEMIHLPVLRHTRRFLASLITFGTTVLLMVWLPIRIIEYLAPEFLPYYVMITSDMPMSELSLELILLQVVLPALLEQGHTRQWLKLLVRGWCICVSYMLDLRSYLLGDVVVQPPSQDQPNPPVEPAIVPQDVRAGGRLGVAHQALFQSVSQSTALPYKKPKFMAFKIFCLVLCICVSLTLASLLMLTVPVFIGRKIMAMWMGTTRVHELYTVGCGLYACWLSLRLLSLLFSWIPMGWASISAKLKEWMSISIKSMCAMSVMLGIVPLLMGLLFDLLIIVPLRVPLHQTPLISLWQDWALGVLHTKIMCALTLMGPNWWLKRVIEQVYLGGFRNINLHVIFIQLALPLVMLLGLCLSVPYIYACSILPMFTTSFETQNLVLRRIYPAVLVLLLLSGAIVFQIRQFFRLYEHIKNDKYLVGKRLVNYDHRRNALLSQATAGDSVAS